MSNRDEQLKALRGRELDLLRQRYATYHETLEQAEALRAGVDRAALALMSDYRVTLKEIAETLGITTGRAHQIIQRARKLPANGQ